MTAELPGFQQFTAERNLFKASELPRTRNASRVVIATLFALVVASCGSGDDADEEGGPNPPPPPPAMAELTVTITGQGEVMTPDQTLMCDSSCVFEVEQGKSVTLNAVPAADYDFSLWQGDCSSSLDTPICSLDVDTDKNVFAGFTQRSSGNSPPQAVVTGDKVGLVNTALQLSGEQSSDADGDPLTYQWTLLSTPTGANATLGSPTEMLTTFQGNAPGFYVLSLVVSDGQQSSAPVNYAIGLSVEAPGNTPPVATITGDASGETQALLRLSGAQSSDADGDALSYQWSVLSTPTSATAALGSPTQVETTFQGDTAGVYVVGLIVHDGQESSQASIFVISLSAASGNTPPVAVITGDASGETQELLQLSGALSSDADGDPLTYQWSVQSTPASANAVLGTPTQAQTTFQGDVAGSYTVSLVVDDGQESSAATTFEVQLSGASGNTPPVAVITGDAFGETQALLQLSGTQSSDADGDPLTYQWSVQSAPATSNAVLGTPTQAQTTFQGDVAGSYMVSLVVDDGQESSQATAFQVQLSDPVPDSVAGTISVSPGNFDPGAVLNVTVTDADLDTDDASAQSVTVTAFNQSTNESELLTLTETGVSTGQFEGSVATASGGAGPDNDGQLLVQDGDIVRIEYQDMAPANLAVTRAYVGDLPLMTNPPDMGVTSSSGVGTAVTFGVVFAPDQLLPNERPMIGIGPDSFDGQANIMTRYPSGAPQHVLFSHHAPVLGAGQNASINFFIDFNPPSTETLSLGDLPAGYASGTAVEIVQAGTPYSVTVAEAIQVSAQEHFNGPVAAEWVLRAPLTDATGAEHPWLTARFYVRLYSNGETATIPVLQNVKAFRGNPPTSISLGSVTFRVAGSVRHSQSNTAIGHHSLGTPDEVYWWSQSDGSHSKSLYVLHDYQYMRDRALLFPHFNPARAYTGGWFDQELSNTRASLGIQGLGKLQPNMPSSSWRGLVGPLPVTNLGWLTTQQPGVSQAWREKAYETMFTNALKMGSYHAQVEDENTFEPISIETYPAADLYGSVIASVPGWYGGTPTADIAHQPVIHQVPYVTTGWSHFLRQAKTWQTFNWLYRPHGSARRPDPSRPEIWSEQQYRGQAWIVYNMSDLSRMIPDADPDKAYWGRRLDNGMDWYYENYITPGTRRSPVGFFTMRYPWVPWGQSGMLDMLAVSFAHAAAVSEITGIGDSQRIRAVADYGMSGTVNRLVHEDAIPEIWAHDKWYIRNTTADGFGAYSVPALQTMAEVVEKTFAWGLDNPAPFSSLHPRGGLVLGGTFGSQARADEINARIAAWHCSPSNNSNCLQAGYQPGDQIVYMWPPGSFSPSSGGFVSGYTGWKGYPGYCQGAVAAAVDAGVPGATEAWSRYQSFGNQWTYGVEQYQFDVLPRP